MVEVLSLKQYKNSSLQHSALKHLPLEYLKNWEMVKSYRQVELKSDENPDKWLKLKYIPNLLRA